MSSMEHLPFLYRFQYSTGGGKGQESRGKPLRFRPKYGKVTAVESYRAEVHTYMKVLQWCRSNAMPVIAVLAAIVVLVVKLIKKGKARNAVKREAKAQERRERMEKLSANKKENTEKKE